MRELKVLSKFQMYYWFRSYKDCEGKVEDSKFTINNSKLAITIPFIIRYLLMRRNGR